MRIQSRQLVAALLVLGGCSYSVFSDFEDQAPAARITQNDSEIRSANFGDHLVGLSRGAAAQGDPAGLVGGVLAITGNGSAAIATATVTGSVRVAHAEAGEVRQHLDSPTRITAMAPAPSGAKVGAHNGPFAWIGTEATPGSVRVLDVTTFKKVGTALKRPGRAKFGLSVAAANLDQAGDRDDVAVGAEDALVLLRAWNSAGQSWPVMNEGSAVTATAPGQAGWPQGGFSVIATGNLDPDTKEDEVVAAVPEKNAVVVIHHIADCFAADAADAADVPCKSFLPIHSDNAERLGAALLVADVDADGKVELVVGAPAANKVLVYDLEASHFASPNPTKLPEPTVLTVSDATDFGDALALGKFDGGAKPLLAVGAPGTEVGGAKAAGRIYLFDMSQAPPQQVGEGVALATPEENTMLGRTLAVLPYAKSGATLDVLAAGGRDAVFVFFSNLTKDHEDIRDQL